MLLKAMPSIINTCIIKRCYSTCSYNLKLPTWSFSHRKKMENNSITSKASLQKISFIQNRNLNTLTTWKTIISSSSSSSKEKKNNILYVSTNSISTNSLNTEKKNDENEGTVSNMIHFGKFVDKTKIIAELLSNRSQNQILVVRPRRFGKTFFLKTIMEVCKGKKELFKDCFIGKSNYNWSEYPVIYLNLADLNLDSYGDCKDSLRSILEDIAYENNLKIRGSDPVIGFGFLIKDLKRKTNKNVVVLIDEYDTPIVRSNKNNKIKENIANIVKRILESCKSRQDDIKLAFITGITTCPLTDIYSGPNHLSECTYDEKFATTFGYTKNEIQEAFKNEITELAETLRDEANKQLTFDETMSLLQKKYNGYKFSVTGEAVYNPFSISKCLSNYKLKNYWYNSNSTCTFFIDKVIKNPRDYDVIQKIPLDYSEKELYTNKNIGDDGYFKQVLLQAGYLTIQPQKNGLTLTWPNEEIEHAFQNSLIMNIINKSKEKLKMIENGPEIISDLQNFDVELLLKTYNLYLKTLDFSIGYEYYYHSTMHALLLQIGIEPLKNIKINSTKCKFDTAFHLGTTGYIFEYGVTKKAKANVALLGNLKMSDIYTKEYYKFFEDQKLEVDQILLVSIICQINKAAFYKSRKAYINSGGEKVSDEELEEKIL